MTNQANATPLAAAQTCARELLQSGHDYLDIANGFFSAAAGILSVLTGREPEVAKLATAWALLGCTTDAKGVADGRK
ncbi:hypothetical protein BTE77_02335 [Ensifer adhaerens]|nr:hypothetical protein BTE77_02335 [Ensifer adhaerens]